MRDRLRNVFLVLISAVGIAGCGLQDAAWVGDASAPFALLAAAYAVYVTVKQHKELVAQARNDRDRARDEEQNASRERLAREYVRWERGARSRVTRALACAERAKQELLASPADGLQAAAAQVARAMNIVEELRIVEHAVLLLDPNDKTRSRVTKVSEKQGVLGHHGEMARLCADQKLGRAEWEGPSGLQRQALIVVEALRANLLEREAEVGFAIDEVAARIWKKPPDRVASKAAP